MMPNPKDNATRPPQPRRGRFNRQKPDDTTVTPETKSHGAVMMPNPKGNATRPPQPRRGRFNRQKSDGATNTECGVSFADWLSEYNLSARFVALSS